MSDLAVSVVVPVRDGASLLPGLLTALAEQTLAPERYEVVVVDDASSDATPGLLAEWRRADPGRCHAVRIEGGGPSRARNEGVRRARGAWIAFTDADVVPEREWLEELLRVAGSNGAAVIEGAVHPLDAEAVGPHTHQAVNLDGGYYMTANIAYRRDVLDAIGGFDERFDEPSMEDADLAFRALDAGYGLVFAPEVRVLHRVLTPSPRSRVRAARRMRYIPLLARKHPERTRRHDLHVLTPPELHILAGVLAAGAVPFARGAARLALLAAAANAARVIVQTGRLDVEPSLRAEQAFVSVAVPVCKAWWALEGWLRFRSAG